MADKEGKRVRSPVTRFLSRYAWPYRRYLLLMILVALAARGAAIASPQVIKGVFNYSLEHKGTHLFGHALSPLQLLNLSLLAMMGLALIGGLFIYAQRMLSATAGHKIIFDLRFDLFHHLQTLSPGFYDRRSTGRVMSRLISDIDSAREMVSGVLVGPTIQLATLAWVLIMMFRESATLTLVALAISPLYLYTFYTLSPRLREASRRVQMEKAIISGTLQERIAGIRVVQSFTRERTEEIRLFSQAGDLLRTVIYRASLSGRLTAIASTLTGLGTAVIIWYGASQVLHGSLTKGGFIAFYVYLGMLYTPLAQLAEVGETYQTAAASIDRIFRLLDTQSEVRDKPDAVELAQCQGAVAFENVTFGYSPERPVLKNVCLQARRGDRIALVGPSGAGKTTVVNLLMRFYEPTAGRVLVDGRNILDYTVLSLRRHTGYVAQDPMLFSGTVAENIMYGRRGASMREVMEAAKAANAHQFITELTEGYETQVGERGVRLSGGQVQRLAIARALLRGPEILILDEATSSVDSVSEALIQQALERLMRGRTTFIIAHRLSTVMGATQILVLDQGEVVERGTHEELVANGALYARLCREQMQADEWVLAGEGDTAGG
jgi:subfamily B ATP-binding cassette protein MsbA